MLKLIVILFSIYTALKVYISVMQIGFIISKRDKEPLLMSQSEYIKAANYAIAKEKLSLLMHFVAYFTFLFWVLFGFGYFYSLFFTKEYTTFLISLFFVITFFTIDYLASLPFALYQTFSLDQKFGFSKITPKIFIIDQIKSILFFLTLGVGVASLLIWIVESFSYWWLYAFLVMIALILLINFLYPTIIAPLFNKFSPLEDDALRYDIEHLMQKSGMQSSGIFVMDASKRDSRLNAYFGGLGKSKRVVLFDTLLSKLSHDELLAVLGHELGHFKHGDIFKNIFLMSLLLFIVFFLLGHLPDSLFGELHTAPFAGAKLVFIMLVFSLITFIWMPIISYFSKKHEYEADKYASQVSDKNSLVTALLKMVKENSSFPLSDPIYIFFYYSHPPIIQRLKKLGWSENTYSNEEFSLVGFLEK